MGGGPTGLKAEAESDSRTSQMEWGAWSRVEGPRGFTWCQSNTYKEHLEEPWAWSTPFLKEATVIPRTKEIARQINFRTNKAGGTI